MVKGGVEAYPTMHFLRSGSPGEHIHRQFILKYVIRPTVNMEELVTEFWSHCANKGELHWLWTSEGI